MKLILGHLLMIWSLVLKIKGQYDYGDYYGNYGDYGNYTGYYGDYGNYTGYYGNYGNYTGYYGDYGNYTGYYGNYSDYGDYYGGQVECGGELVELSGTISTPGYPTEDNPTGTYPPHTQCLWYRDGDQYTMVQWKFWDLGIEIGAEDSNETCDYDYVNVSITSPGARRYCGYTTPTEEIRGTGTIEVTFVSDDSVNYRGFTATYIITPGRNPCDPNPCAYGTCETYENGLLAKCICDPGYTGEQCELDIAECGSNPCRNGGKCEENESNKYTCVCGPGFSGINCEIVEEKGEEPSSPCSPNPCLHNGECVELKDDYKCNCQPNYEGVNCEIITGCGNPGIPYIDTHRRFTYGDTVQFSCEKGFVLSGPTNLSCFEDGTWSKDMPTCIANNTDSKDDKDSISTWEGTMIGLGVALGANLLVFTYWMVGNRPWLKIEPGNKVTWNQDNISINTISIEDDSDFSENDDSSYSDSTD